MPSMNPQGNGMPVPPMNPQGKGMPMPSMNPQNSMTVNCSKCGAAMDRNLNFCTRCGTKLNKDVPTPNISENKSPFARNDKPDVKSENPEGNNNITPSDIIREKADISEDKKSDNIKCVNCGSDIEPEVDLYTECGAAQEKKTPQKPKHKVSLEKKDSKNQNISDKSKIKKSSTLRENLDDKPIIPHKTPEDKPLQEQPPENPTDDDFVIPKGFLDKTPKGTLSGEIKCPKCGAAMKSDLNFCTMCGTNLQSAADEKPPILSVSPVPHKTPEDKPLQEQPPENSTVPTVPPIIQENPTDNQPKKRMGIFIKKSKNSNNDIKPPISEVSPEPAMSQGQLSDNSPEPAMSQGQLSDNSPEPPMSQGQLSDNLPEPPMSQGQLSDNSPEPPMSQGQLSDNSPEPPMSQGQPSDNSPEPTKYDDKPNQNYDNFKTNFALSETALEFLNKKPEIPENDIKPEENKPLDNREVKCSNCGSVMSRGMKFCTLCGSMLGDALNTPTPSMPDDSAVSSIPSMSVDSKVPPIPPIPTDSDVFSIELNSIPSGMKKCGKCNSIVAASVRFCTSCGNRMSENIPEPSAKVNNAPFSKTKCGNCGAVFDSDMKFCTSCGSPLGNTPNTSATPSLSGLDGGTVYAVSSESVEEYGKPESILSENITSDNDYSSPLYSMPTVVLSHSPFEEEEVDSAPTINLDGQMCPNCKSIMASDMLFCTECGTRL